MTNIPLTPLSFLFPSPPPLLFLCLFLQLEKSSLVLEDSNPIDIGVLEKVALFQMEHEQDGLVGAGIIAALPDTVGVPSECLLLKNMFDPSTETEPDFDEDIKDDVQIESSKFGRLKHMYVDKNNRAGFVYMRIDNVQAAMDVLHSLHGRLFGGKMITATYMTTEAYEAKFPESKVD